MTKLARIVRETWAFGLFFFCLGFLLARSPSGDIPWRAAVAASIAFALLVSLWVVRDAKQRGRALGPSYPAFVFLLWPVFAPMYLFQTRGVRAFLSLAGFGVLYYVTAALGALGGTIWSP